MEKIMSTEDKIRRAEEIYNKRRTNKIKTGSTKVNISEKKDVKLLKKIIIQILICLSIYCVFYLIKNNNYIFSEDFINKAKEILSYDVNFQKIYSKIIENLKQETINPQEEEINDDEKENEKQSDNVEENGIGGAEEKNEENEMTGISQMEQDAIDIKNSISFINPIEGTVTSKFGWRNPTTSTVPKYHTGLDIANARGTKVRSATDGNVILVSTKGDYRKPFKYKNK